MEVAGSRAFDHGKRYTMFTTERALLWGGQLEVTWNRELALPPVWVWETGRLERRAHVVPALIARLQHDEFEAKGCGKRDGYCDGQAV